MGRGTACTQSPAFGQNGNMVHYMMCIFLTGSPNLACQLTSFPHNPLTFSLKLLPSLFSGISPINLSLLKASLQMPFPASEGQVLSLDHLLVCQELAVAPSDAEGSFPWDLQERFDCDP